MKLSTTGLVLASDSPIDLHLHTTYSDGEWAPGQLLDHLAQEQFALVAIADHDRADTVPALQRLALEKHLPLLAAAEMTTLWQDKTSPPRLDEMSGLPDMTDLLCYGFDPAKDALNALAQDLLRRQRENTREVFENLLRKGYTFPQSPDALESLLKEPSPQQPHALAALLIKNGIGTGDPSAGRIILEAGCAFAMNDLAAVVDAAHQGGAVCLIAHPGHKEGFITYDAPLLDKLRQEVPIDGLEVYSSKHTPEQDAMYLDYAQKNHLLVSAGSDSHRPAKPPIKYPAALCRDLLERVGIQIKG